MEKLKNSILELVKSASTRLPSDVIAAISKYAVMEKDGTAAKYAMDIIRDNISLAMQKVQPICQDTGSILFFVNAPKGFDETAFIKEAENAVAEATEKGFLRQNSVDSLTGKNSGNNLGPGSPSFHFKERAGEVDVRLILKGGGCENVGIQYSLPYAPLAAGRNIGGVKRCILDSVLKAEGKGCAPGVLGVAIGGDRGTAYLHSKEQFLRKLDDKNPNTVLAEIEEETVEKANKLGIGPMGFGGKTTIFGCKIGVLNRLPASYFVTVSYMCWAYRRQGVILNDKGMIKKWLY